MNTGRLAALLVLLAPMAGQGCLYHAPGTLHASSTAPLTDEQLALRAELRADVEHLAGEIGPRNSGSSFRAVLAAERWLLERLDETDYDPVIEEGMDEMTLHAHRTAFVAKAHEWGEEIPAGVFLDNRSTSTFLQRVETRIENYRANPPHNRPIADANGKPTADLSKIFDEVRMR